MSRRYPSREKWFGRMFLNADLSLPYYQDGKRASSYKDANLISSELWGQNDIPKDDRLHAPALDFDFPCRLIPSSTKGHFHLYIDKTIPWKEYVKVLEVLGEVGLLEPGYVEAAKRRQATHLRLPGVKKDPDQMRREEAVF